MQTSPQINELISDANDAFVFVRDIKKVGNKNAFQNKNTPTPSLFRHFHEVIPQIRQHTNVEHLGRTPSLLRATSIRPDTLSCLLHPCLQAKACGVTVAFDESRVVAIGLSSIQSLTLSLS